MQLLSFYLFTIICGYSLVISAPVKESKTPVEETKQQKATAIASRLLKELANEQHVSNEQHQKQEQSSDNTENTDIVKPAEEPKKEKVVPSVLTENKDSGEDDDDDSDDNGSEYLDPLQVFDELYEINGNQYEPELFDEDLSSKPFDHERLFQISRQQLMKYLADQYDSDEDFSPVVHTELMDDGMMAAEDH